MATDGFLSRWSRRKLSDDKAPARAAQDPGPPLAGADIQVSTATGPVSATDGAKASLPLQPETAPAQQEALTQMPQAPLPTLQDIPALTHESDFKPYLSKGVEPQVRNAAMKKLFTDPRYNVMDRLDTYIDDYSKPDPIPESMLRKMVSAQFLGLFDEKKEEAGTQPQEQAKGATGAPVLTDAALPPGPAADETASAQDHTSMETQSQHADADLRLQPNHAPAAQEPGRGAG